MHKDFICYANLMETNEQICDLFKTVKNNIDTRTFLRIKEDNPALRDNNLGNQIAFYREKKKLTQMDLSHKSGIPQATISRLESFRSTPTLQNLIKISNALDLSLFVKQNGGK